MSVVDGLPFAEDKKQYILNVLDPILEEMVSDVLTEMPESPLDHMTRWLRKRNGGSLPMRMSIQAKNAALKQELKQNQDALEEAGRSVRGEAAPKEEDEEEEEDDEDDGMDDIPDRMDEQKIGRARQSVSAEAYGQWNQKKAFVAPKHAKTDEQKERLSTTLLRSFMFSELEPNDMETILMAMKEVSFEAGKQVITEGENGDYLFVIEKGSLDCIKSDSGKVVKTCVEGEVFGELSLLYNQARAASVVAKEDCVCWQLDRESFNNIVRDSAVKRREKYDAFLQQVSLIQSLDSYQRSQVADALKPETYSKGDVIVKQDEPGDKFYIIEEGQMYAMKQTDTGEKRVMDYKGGDYFGELALLRNQPRAASVVVASDTAKVLSMSRLAFIKMLGPLQKLLEKKVASYA